MPFLVERKEKDMEEIIEMNFRDIKDDLKTRIFDNANNSELFNNLLARFEYNGLPLSDLDLIYLELYLLSRGDCAFWQLGKKYVVTPCERIGNIDEYGRGMDLLCTTLNGKQKKFKNFQESQDVVYIKSNPMATPDRLTIKDAESLTELLKSIDCVVVNTRYTNLIGVDDEKQRIAVDSAISGAVNGRPAVVVANPLFDEDGAQGVRNIPLTDPRSTDIIQYLHRAYDDILRRFWNRNGLEVCTSTKLAQQTKDEVDSGHNARLVSSKKMLELRKKAMEEINAKFGLNASVKFSEMWEHEEEETIIKEEPQEDPQDEGKEGVDNGED